MNLRSSFAAESTVAKGASKLLDAVVHHFDVGAQGTTVHESEGKSGPGERTAWEATLYIGCVQ